MVCSPWSCGRTPEGGGGVARRGEGRGEGQEEVVLPGPTLQASAGPHLREKKRYSLPLLCICMRSPSNLVSMKNQLCSISFGTWSIVARCPNMGLCMEWWE